MDNQYSVKLYKQQDKFLSILGEKFPNIPHVGVSEAKVFFLDAEVLEKGLFDSFLRKRTRNKKVVPVSYDVAKIIDLVDYEYVIFLDVLIVQPTGYEYEKLKEIFSG